MANPYVEKEVKSILENKDFQYPSNAAYAAAWIVANFKGVNLKIFDARETSSLADYFIIATTSNIVQSKAISDEVLFNLKQNAGMENISTEGLSDGEWILIDMGDIIVHLFQENSRDVYDLDALWRSMPQLKVPNDYYHSNIDVTIPGESEESPSSNGFF